MSARDDIPTTGARSLGTSPSDSTPPETRPVEITATVPTGPPPAWAVLQRHLFDELDGAWRLFSDRYTEPDGRLRFSGTIPDRDGADDFYEAFFNWPALYRLGGADDLLPAVKRHWEGVTAQLTELGLYRNEFERGYDWFHQGEALLMFYGICAADPTDQRFRERARRFAEQYLPGSTTGNYDPATRTLRSPHNGSDGPRPGLGPQWDDRFGHEQRGMRPYGLPLRDVPGITSWEDLADEDNAVRMGHAMRDRLGRGDTAVDLAATALVVNAWLYDHDPRLADWVLEYVDAWRERAAAAGVMPDNVGPSGKVGEDHGGRWYGGHYGWTWPHGVHSIGAATLVGAISAGMLGRADARLDLARRPLDQVWEQRRTAMPYDTGATRRPGWAHALGLGEGRTVNALPTRVGPEGWFDHQPAQVAYWTWLWWFGMCDEDRARLDRVREHSGYDWREVHAFRDKEEAGHEAPWLAYLDGDNPDYPERALRMALAQVAHRTALMTAEATDTDDLDLHKWQRVNPVVTEVLTQLTTGAPQTLYNGGLPLARVRYDDLDAARPGLPRDVAALVEHLDAVGTTVQLVNLSAVHTRRLRLLAGGFGEHLITEAHWTGGGEHCPGDSHDHHLPAGPETEHSAPVDDNGLHIVLPPGRRIRLRLDMRLNARPFAHHTSPTTFRRTR
ncbi:hypothetical protein [Streptomyces tendae]|uniref:DUF2264 domain-containing protein n=1 Tax=Streptomyces tendae TaxID=1932 RepID=A0ABW7S436_STRTE|nr:hypothetical protein RGQ21_71040 [Kitasatospora aureofaciens]